MRILTVVGNRPQFVKAAVISPGLRKLHREVLVHTGAHHQESLSKVFFDELRLPAPHHHLGVSGGSNTSQVARVLTALEPIIREAKPDATLVYGDTNSTLASALCSAQASIPVIHVEAGMRSFDKTMPEELNRVLTDHLSDLLLCPSASAAANLANESIGHERASSLAHARAETAQSAGTRSIGRADAESIRRASEVVVIGDVMVDLALRLLPAAATDFATPTSFGLTPGEYLLISAHRAGNVDTQDRLRALVQLICALPLPVLFPVHPRTAARLAEHKLEDKLRDAPHVQLTQPLAYSQFSSLLCHAKAVLTDSGGVQKEAYVAGVKCVTLRENTEWTETVKTGWNTLAGLDIEAVGAALAKPPPAARPSLYGDGKAAEKCIAAIDAWLGR